MVLTLKPYKPLSRISDAHPGGIEHPAGKGEIRFACRILTRYGQVVIDFGEFSDLISYSDSLGVESASGNFTIRMRANLCNEELLKKIHPGYVIEVYAARNDDPLLGVNRDPSRIRRVDTTPDLSVIPSAPTPSPAGSNAGIVSSSTQASELTPRRRAFLDVIAYAEGTSGENGYSTQFTGRQFSGFADHPRQVIRSGGYSSSAAGRYQILESTWDEIRRQRGLADFSPANQDRAAIALIERRGALAAVDAGNFEEALRLTNREWASLPGAPYGQPTKTAQELRRVYEERLTFYSSQGGQSAPTPPPVTNSEIRTQQTQRYSTTRGNQRYGAPRSNGRRRHAGVDLDISGAEATAISFIGGVCSFVGFNRCGYWDYVDIWNERLQVVERIAEYNTPFGVKVGDTILPGQAIGKGEKPRQGEGCSFGVIHYEIRPRNNVGSGLKRGSGGFESTTDPIAFLRQLGIDPYAEPSKVFQNARIQPPAGGFAAPAGGGVGGGVPVTVPVVALEGAVVEPVEDYYLDKCPHLLFHGIITDYGRATDSSTTLTISGEDYGKIYRDAMILLDQNAPSSLGWALEVRTQALAITAVSYIYYQILKNWVENFWGMPTGWEARTRVIPVPPNYLARISEGSAWSGLQYLSIPGLFHLFIDHTGALVWEKLPWSSADQSLIDGRTWEGLQRYDLPSWKIISWNDRLSEQGISNFVRVTPTLQGASGGQDSPGQAGMVFNMGSIRQYGGPTKREIQAPYGVSQDQWYTSAPRREAQASFNSFSDLCVLEAIRWYDRPIQRCDVSVRGESAWRINTRVELTEDWHCADAKPGQYYVTTRSNNIDIQAGEWRTSMSLVRDRRNRYLGIGVGEVPTILDKGDRQSAVNSERFTGTDDATARQAAPNLKGKTAIAQQNAIKVPLVPDEYYFFDRYGRGVIPIGNDPIKWARENVIAKMGQIQTTAIEEPKTDTGSPAPEAGGSTERADVKAPFLESDSPPGSYTLALERDRERITGIPSPINGVVVQSTRLDDLGNVVEVRGSDGTSWLLGHLDARAVRVGQRVTRGQILGNQGATGNAESPHTLLQIRRLSRGASRIITDRSVTRPLVERYLGLVSGSNEL